MADLGNVIRKPPRPGWTLVGLPDSGTSLCQCIPTSGGFERCPLCGIAGRTKEAKAMLGNAPTGFYEFCGHLIVKDSAHYRDHRLDYSLHTADDCLAQSMLNLSRRGSRKL